MIAIGCAYFDLGGGIKDQLNDKIELRLPQAIKSVYLEFPESKGEGHFETVLKESLQRNGYLLVDTPQMADLELKIYYKLLRATRSSLSITFLVPWYNSYETKGLEVKVMFKTAKHSGAKVYRAEYGEYKITDAIIDDLKKREEGGDDGKEGLR
jgi:hypothetical protein